MFMVVKNVAKNASLVTILLMKPLLLYQKQLNGNIRQKGIAHAKQMMLYIWLTAPNLEFYCVLETLPIKL